MKIVQINTFDIQGGAARAAYRLHKGLVQIGQDEKMLVLKKDSNDPNVISFNITENKDGNIIEELRLYGAIQESYINKRRTNISNTIFSLPYCGYDLAGFESVKSADVINIHWINYFQSLDSIRKLLSIGKPVVWTLHDQWAFTGGCHYSTDCNRYVNDCSNCPQLISDPFNVASSVLKDKLEMLNAVNLTIVTPSKWLGECARKSILFKNRRVEVIPYSLETDEFVPAKKAEAKQKLDILPDTTTLLFGAAYGQEKRKGFEELFEAMKICIKNKEFSEMLENGKLKILSFGHSGNDLDVFDFPVKRLGYISSDSEISNAYSAADIFILPSLEDNLPNTLLESMSCGTAVIGFDVGGIPDVLINDVTGKLVPAKNIEKMAEAILDLVFDAEKREALSENCRKLISDKFALEVQAKNYVNLYSELLRSQTRNTSPALEGISNDNSITSIENDSAFVELKTGPHFQQILQNISMLYEHENTALNVELSGAKQANMALNVELSRVKQANTALREQIDALENRMAKLRKIPGYHLSVRMAKMIGLIKE